MHDLNQFAPTELQEVGRLALQRRDQAAEAAKKQSKKNKPKQATGKGR